MLDDLGADPKERVVCRLQAGAGPCGFRQKETSLTYLLQACGLAQPMVVPGNVGRRTAASHKLPEPADNCVERRHLGFRSRCPVEKERALHQQVTP